MRCTGCGGEILEPQHRDDAGDPFCSYACWVEWYREALAEDDGPGEPLDEEDVD